MDLVTRTAIRTYKERYLTAEQGRPIQDLLFSTMDEDTSSSFRGSRYLSSPFGITYRNPTNQSIVRQFTPGTTELIEVPRASEKTPIDEDLRDAVAVGHEATDGQMMNLAANVEQIVGDHIEGHNMTKAKQALDVIRTGIFNAKGDKGADLDLDYDMGRSGSAALTYDFTAAGATMNEALANISNYLDSTGTPKGNRYAIMGSTWLSQFGSDSGIIELMKANAVNQVLAQDMFDRQYGNVNGLFVVAQYRPVGALAPLWLLSYEPGTDYVAYKGATAAPFVPATELLAGSLNDKTWNVKRGVDALNENGEYQRSVGDLVVDSFTETDPVTTFVRSQTRHIYLYGNIDHTCKSTGTFV